MEQKKLDDTRKEWKDSYKLGLEQGYLEGFREAEDLVDKILMGGDNQKPGYPWCLLTHIIQNFKAQGGNL